MAILNECEFCGERPCLMVLSDHPESTGGEVYVACPNCLLGLVTCSLTPQQYLRVKKSARIKGTMDTAMGRYYLHSDFYDPDTGVALQPKLGMMEPAKRVTGQDPARRCWEPDEAIQKCLRCQYHTRVPEEGDKVDFLGCTQGIIAKAAGTPTRALSWIRRRDKVFDAIVRCPIREALSLNVDRPTKFSVLSRGEQVCAIELAPSEEDDDPFGITIEHDGQCAVMVYGPDRTGVEEPE